MINSTYSEIRQKMLGDLVMSPSMSSEQINILKNKQPCKGIGMTCDIAEDCCTLLCLKRYNECVI
ncbi:uncharacterized protein Dvir_GJ16543, isoform A [Drosophila virilis]|uniref:Uncharacterized protein, isoform A n=1 Tax=Drosophila virilis TaxID=7244 RepID=B4LSN4_DROVI|nr:uncharacterized protein Dvir_GJ16543, isoform A [Drosophila virilis]